MRQLAAGRNSIPPHGDTACRDAHSRTVVHPVRALPVHPQHKAPTGGPVQRSGVAPDPLRPDLPAARVGHGTGIVP
jgi:hypothetical protein